MRSSHSLDRIDVAFDDDHLVADAGLLLPATLAAHLGLKGLVDRFLDLGRAAGRANVGDKFLTLLMSALAGGDCIDDAGALRAGGTERVPGFRVKAPSTLGTFLRSFRWGHVRQLDRVSRELLARAWAAGAGPGSAPLTIAGASIEAGVAVIRSLWAMVTEHCWPSTSHKVLSEPHHPVGRPGSVDPGYVVGYARK